MRAVLDATDAAYYLHTSELQVRELVKTRKIPHRFLGRRLLFVISDIERWLSTLGPEHRKELLPHDSDEVPEDETSVHDTVTTEEAIHATRTEEKTIRGYVYIFRSGPYYKIWQTTNLKKRLSNKTDMAELPELIHTIPARALRFAESILHDKFKQKRIHGEWFKLTDKDVQWIQQQKSITFEGHVV